MSTFQTSHNWFSAIFATNAIVAGRTSLKQIERRHRCRSFFAYAVRNAATAYIAIALCLSTGNWKTVLAVILGSTVYQILKGYFVESVVQPSTKVLLPTSAELAHPTEADAKRINQIMLVLPALIGLPLGLVMWFFPWTGLATAIVAGSLVLWSEFSHFCALFGLMHMPEYAPYQQPLMYGQRFDANGLKAAIITAPKGGGDSVNKALVDMGAHLREATFQAPQTVKNTYNKRYGYEKAQVKLATVKVVAKRR